MKRILYLDYVKGLTMLFVVWLHCIQFFSGDVFNNVLFSTVISFHMPIFMVVSGYLFYPKLYNGNFGAIIKKQFCRLIVPSCTWGIIGYVAGFTFVNKWGGVNSLLHILHIPFDYWFLSTLFICSVAYLTMNRLVGEKLGALWQCILLSVLAICFSPSEYLTFFIPVFGAGILIRHYKILDTTVNSLTRIWIVIVLLVGLFAIWNYKYSIYYISNPSPLHFETERIVAYIMRLIIGIGLSVALLLLFKRFEAWLPFKGQVLTISRNSLPIYVIHVTILPFIAFNLALPEWLIDGLTLMATIAMIALINCFVALCRRSSVLRIFLLGEYNYQG